MTPEPSSPTTDRVQFGASHPIGADIPGIDRVTTRIARALTDLLSTLASPISVDDGGMRSCTLAEWQSDLARPMATAHFHDVLIKPGLSVVMPLDLIIRLTDAFYGGAGSVDVSRGLWGNAERRLFTGFATSAAKAVSTAWHDGDGGTPTLLDCTLDTTQSPIFAASDPILVQTFTLRAGTSEAGQLAILYPFVGMRGRMQKQDPAVTAKPPVDAMWKARLSEAVMETRVPVRTIIARPELPLGRVMALAPGDIIPITLPTWVPLTVGGRKLAHGTIGDAGGRAAIKIHSFEGMKSNV